MTIQISNREFYKQSNYMTTLANKKNANSEWAYNAGYEEKNTIVYTIKIGDTLSKIAAQYGITVDDIVNANNIEHPDFIYVNDTLIIPNQSSSDGTDGTQGQGTVAQNIALSDKGLDLICSFEGLRLDAYQDSGGVWTIGYGHTGSDVQPGQHISESRARELLRQDVATAEKAVRNLVKVPLTQGQYDALVSFTFNCGSGTLRNSTLLKKLNAGDYSGAQAEFGKFVHAGGQTLAGLVRRRQAEAEMFGNKAPDSSQSMT